MHDAVQYSMYAEFHKKILDSK